jgi:hypothetical protein
MDSLAVLYRCTASGTPGTWVLESPTEVWTATKEPTGFESPELIAVAYDSTARTVTLTQAGGIPYWFQGVRYTLTSPWTSAAHTATDGSWYLMFGAGGAFSWSQTSWSFDTNGPVCYVNYNTPTGVTFALREVHGLMPWQTHQELHEQVGTYRRSGGTPTAGTYILNTDTNAAITPGFDAAVVADEDLPSTIPALTEGSYAHMRVAAGSVSAFRLAESYLLRTTGTYPNWNNATTGAETEADANRFLNVYQVLVPVTSEAGSQTYRMIFIQPQASFTSLAAAQAEDFRSLSLGSLTALSPEFSAFTRLTFATAAANTTVGKVRLVALAYLTGPRSSQVVSSAVTPASHTVLADRSDPDQHPASAITNTPAGNIAATTVQAAINELDTEKVAKAGDTLTGLLETVASAAVAGAGFRIPHGTAPTSPTNGDVWSTTAGMYVRINGVTVGPLSIGAVTFSEPAADNSAGTQSIFDSATVGESVAFPDLLYLKSDGKWWKADADAASTMPGLRMALETKSADAACSMLVQGRVRDDDWNWTVGGLIYASGTAGALTQTAPSGTTDIVQIVGIAYHADKMIFNPEADTLEIQ